MASSPVPSPVQFQAPPAAQMQQWFPVFIRALNVFITQTVQALQTQAKQYKTLTINTGATVADSFPIIFTNPLTDTPRDIHVARATPGSSYVLAGACAVAWSITSSGQIQIVSITGLNTNSSYEIALSVS